jgi:hypothetical protein
LRANSPKSRRQGWKCSPSKPERLEGRNFEHLGCLIHLGTPVGKLEPKLVRRSWNVGEHRRRYTSLGVARQFFNRNRAVWDCSDGSI